MEYKIASIIPTLMGGMESDGENESEELLRYYIFCTSQERAIVNNVMIYICGWSFETLLVKCGLEMGDDGEVRC